MVSEGGPVRPRIRIAQIIYGFGVEGGGAARLAIELARQLDRERFDTMIAALWDCGSSLEKETVSQLREEGIPTVSLAPWDPHRPTASLIASYRKLRAELRKRPANILHSHSEFGDIAILPFAGQATKLVRTIHNGYRVEWRKRPLRRLLLTNILYPMAFHREIAINQGVAGTLNRRPVARLLGKQAEVIPNGIDLNRFRAPIDRSCALRENLHIPEGAFVLGSVGRLAEGKGLDILLHAAARLVQEDLPVYLMVIGDGPLRASLEELALELGIQSTVIFTGPRADIDQVFACMDLFVSASYWEGISTVVLESMAAGIPVIATAIPGHSEILVDGVHGWLVPAGEVPLLADTIACAFKDPEERKTRAQNARVRVQNFSIKTIVARHEDLYQEAALR